MKPPSNQQRLITTGMPDYPSAEWQWRDSGMVRSRLVGQKWEAWRKPRKTVKTAVEFQEFSFFAVLARRVKPHTIKSVETWQGWL